MRLIWGLLLSFGVCGAAHAGGGSLSAPDGTLVRLAAGESGILRLRVQGDSVMTGGLWTVYIGASSFPFTASAAAAGCPALGPMVQDRALEFDPTQSAGDLLCEYTITRSATSMDDMIIRVTMDDTMGGTTAVSYYLGIAPSLVVSTRQESVELLPDGRVRGLARIFLSTDSPRDIAGVSVGSCRDPEIDFPFLFNGNIDGGCGDMSLFGATCLTDGEYGFGRTPFPAQSATSCLVELTTIAPYAGPESVPIYFDQEYVADAKTGAGMWSRQPRTPRTLGLSLELVFANGFD